MNPKDDDMLNSSTKMVAGIRATIINLAETIVWGKATQQDVLTLRDVKEWFRDSAAMRKGKVRIGALARLDEPISNEIRIYQAIFDDNLKCLRSRHVVVGKIAPDLGQEFGSTDVL